MNWQIWSYFLVLNINILPWTNAQDQLEEDPTSTTPIYESTTSVNQYNGYRISSKLIEINSLEDHCVNSICRDFRFDKVDEVAFFDLKTNVRINDDRTYEVKRQLETKELVFENSVFAHFPLNLFYSMGMRELDMRNCSVEEMSWENFLMANELRVLLLSYNKIHTISEMIFNYARNLEFLFLDHNRIRNLVSESFKGLQNLVYLNLAHNRLKNLPEELFSYTPKLKEVILADNHLYEISEQHFSKTPNLMTVSLRNNRLGLLDRNAFKHKNLSALDLAQNTRLGRLILNTNANYLYATNCSLYQVNIYGSVQNIELSHNIIVELYFSQPETLETLNLRNNALEQISSLTRAVNLRDLNLSDNPRLTLLPEAMAGSALKRLDMSNTTMKYLPIAYLAEQSNLETLNVSNNQLQEINPRNFKYLENLKYFYINANDWNCYNLRMLMDLVLKPKHISYSRDIFDDEFPGEYIEGIACMYRIENSAESQNIESTPQCNDKLIMSSRLQAEEGGQDDGSSNSDFDSKQEIEALKRDVTSLRKEMKGIVGFYEEKFKAMNKQIELLNAKVAVFESINEKFFQNVAITV